MRLRSPTWLPNQRQLLRTTSQVPAGPPCSPALGLTSPVLVPQLATILDMLEGAFYGLDLLKLHSVTTKLVGRVDKLEEVRRALGLPD